MAPYLHPLHQHMLMAQTGMPTPGRRAKGYGSSPFGPGGPLPIHQMSFLLGGMGPHGLLRTPFGAGRYPHPRLPFPLGMQLLPQPGMGMGMGMGMDMGMGGPGGVLPMMGGAVGGAFGGGGGGGGFPGHGADMLANPLLGMNNNMHQGVGGASMNPFLMNNSPGLSLGALFPGCGEEDDESTWDSDEDCEGLPPFDELYRADMKAKRKQAAAAAMAAMGMGMGMGPFF